MVVGEGMTIGSAAVSSALAPVRFGLIAVAICLCVPRLDRCAAAEPIAVGVLSGLPERPPGGTCTAAERPSEEFAGPVSVEIVRAFPNLEFRHPIDMVQSAADDSKWYMATREGLVWRFENDDDVVAKRLSLDLGERTRFANDAGSQQWGVTSLALHPNFPSRPFLYVAYNTRRQRGAPVVSVVSRFATADGGETFDADSEAIVLSKVQTGTRYHHLGQIAFGPDRLLYIGFGAPRGTAGQDRRLWDGSILRIDIDGGEPYAIPADNPFVGMAEVRPEIFAWGLRNPWRFSFDRKTGELWAGDIGWDSWEEIDVVVKGGNYGWKIVEGNHCVRQKKCKKTGLIPPVFEYPHGRRSAAVVGGFVYRGSSIPDLVGAYVYADTGTRDLSALFFDAAGVVQNHVIGRVRKNRPQVIAQGNDGELYVMRARGERRGPMRVVPARQPAPGAGALARRLSQSGCIDPAHPHAAPAGTIPYQVRVPQWADGASARRWMSIPPGERIVVDRQGRFEFPVGTVLVQSLSLDDRPVETRLLVRHRDAGWGAYSYEWLADGSDALLLDDGKKRRLPDGGKWRFPRRSQCRACHNETAGIVLGLELAQLAGPMDYPSSGRTADQLTTLRSIGVLDDSRRVAAERLPPLAAVDDTGRSGAERARSYLHANCSSCHRPAGPTQSLIDLRFSVAAAEMNLCRVAPERGDLGIAGASLLEPGWPQRSILYQRMNRRDSSRMPPHGSEKVDSSALEVLREWISSQPDCPPVGAGAGG